MAIEHSYRDHLADEQHYLENELEKAQRKRATWDARATMLKESLARSRKELADLSQTRPETA